MSKIYVKVVINLRYSIVSWILIKIKYYSTSFQERILSACTTSGPVPTEWGSVVIKFVHVEVP